MNGFIFLAVLVFYIHLFNALAKLYFQSDQTMTWGDLWRRFFPSFKITIEM